MTIAIIGGGAAGMMAAITAAESGRHRIVLFERQSRVGRKLAATGNGRCNLSNTGAAECFYHGSDRTFIRSALQDFGVKATLAKFLKLGLVTVAEADGKVYPYSDSANSVVDVLRFSCEGAGVNMLTGCAVTSVKHGKNGFSVISDGGTLEADRVIIACGGAAGGKLGGVRDGYELLRSLGHSVAPLRPSLVQLKTEGIWTRQLKGVRADAAVSVKEDGKITAESTGEVQFTDYGLSGPAIFEVSRAALRAKNIEIDLDLMRHWSKDEVKKMLVCRAKALPKLTASDLFCGMLHNRLGRVLLQYTGIAQTMPLSGLTKDMTDKLAYAVKHFSHKVTGDMGFDNAQVTAGGAHTDEFDPKTMESRIVPGLYAAGEVLDIDGDCGGFNLQWAWSSGHAAGKAAAEL